MSIDEARQVLIALLRSDDWEFTRTALQDGYLLEYTRFSMVDFILNKLESGFPINEVRLGEPPGSNGIAYSMTNVDFQGLYIKIKLEDARALIMSFKVSKHYKGN